MSNKSEYLNTIWVVVFLILAGFIGLLIYAPSLGVWIIEKFHEIFELIFYPPSIGECQKFVKDHTKLSATLFLVILFILSMFENGRIFLKIILALVMIWIAWGIICFSLWLITH